MDAAQLARWTRFAAKGGIGKCTATADCVAESPEDLMFLKNDEITVLMQIPDADGLFLGHCEGVVGRFHGSNVRFHGKLKRPVMTKRSSLAPKSPTPTSAKSPSPLSVREEAGTPPDEPELLPSASSSSHTLLMPNTNTTRPLVISPKRSEFSVSETASVPQQPPETEREPPREPSPDREPTPEPREERARASPALSDGEVGIGLSLLNDGAMDDWSSIGSRYSTASKDDGRDSEGNSNETFHGHPPSPKPSFLSRPSIDSKRPPSLAPSSSTKVSDDWEGTAADIYDDYRYSRYSMASKMSQHSHSSAYSNPPPVPSEPQLSLDAGSGRSVDLDLKSFDLGGAKFSAALDRESKSSHSSSVPSVDSFVALRSPSHRGSDASVYSTNSFVPNQNHLSVPSSAAQRFNNVARRPDSLDIDPAQPSPLLHTRWGSPISSSDPLSPSHSISSFGAPPSAASTAGAASALRQRIEGERSPAPSPSPVMQEAGRSKTGGDIVVEDEEEIPSNVHYESESESESEHGGNVLPPRSPDRPTEAALDSPVDPQVVQFPANSELAPLPPTRSPPTHIQRPSLSDLRASVFLPHPGAPKPNLGPEGAQGPMYIREMPMSSPAADGPGSGTPSSERPANAVNIIKMAISRPPQPPQGYGGPQSGPVQQQSLTIYGRVEQDLSTAMGPVPISFTLEPPEATAPPSGTTTPVRTPVMETPPVLLPANGVAGSGPPSASSSTGTSASNSPLPRPNFFPKAPGARPRSRSFSGVASSSPLSGRDEKPAPTKGSPPSLSRPASFSKLRQQQSASPLSIPHHTVPSSPLRHMTSMQSLSRNNDPPPSPSARRPGHHHLRQMASMASLGHGHPSTSNTPPNDQPAPSPLSRDTSSPAPMAAPTSAPTRPPLHTQNSSTPSATTPPSPHKLRKQTSSMSSRPSIDSERSVPMHKREPSLRTKLSMPNLGHSNGSNAPGLSHSNSSINLVQVKDMDFELVNPLPPPRTTTETIRSSSESVRSIRGRVSSSGSELRPPPMLAIPGSSGPGSAASSPIAESFASASTGIVVASGGPDVEAHRQREQKWISLMGSSASRNGKKVKKLLYEGAVPSSVRYLVWSFLMNSKAREVKGVYMQLGEKGKTRSDVTGQMGRDVKLFGLGSQVSALLTAYLMMVPDVKYDLGLALVAQHIIQLSPEEDAFWLYVSIMDAFLRPYFSVNNSLLEVDATLFGRALEANDPPLFKRLLVEMGLGPAKIIGNWFTTIFVSTLPTDYLNRVWDIFLHEGIPFLMRVALALLIASRGQLLESKSESVLSGVLKRPTLPSTPDALVAAATNLKLKDDDVRKQRIKLEQQVKKQQSQQVQSRRTISLPR